MSSRKMRLLFARNEWTLSSIVPAIVLVVAAGTATARAEPPAERTVVTAVADAGADRILVRWRVEEGTPRYAAFDVLRRVAGGTAFSQLNAQPIVPARTVQEIEDIFGAVGRAQALAEIRAQFGDDYAADLLRILAADAPPQAAMQRRMLPEWNYGAALSFGVGFLDEPVTAGTTHVYEVWGLDARGFRAERLGRATATARSAPGLPAPEDLKCVERRGIAGHLVADLRWEPVDTEIPYFGYDVLRVPAAGPNCPTTGQLRANELPVDGKAPGRVAEGFALGSAHCAGCHLTGRDAAPIAGSTIADYRRRQYPLRDVCPSGPHDTPALNALTNHQIHAIFDYIHETQFTDDGSGTPADPLVAETEYCYRVAARDLLGQRGALAGPERCTARDRKPPPIPAHLQARPGPPNWDKVLSTRGNWEICEISWRTNPGSETTSYRVYRATTVPRFACQEPVLGAHVADLDHDGSAARTVFRDDAAANGIQESDAGWPFFYAVRALDAAGNASGFSGWVPCTPRDIGSPGQTIVSVHCPSACPPGCCTSFATRPAWLAAGGDPSFLVSDPTCPPNCRAQVDSSFPDDTLFVRSHRCFSDVPTSCRPGDDFRGNPIDDGFAPALDTRIWTASRAFDHSGNLGPLSSLVPLSLIGREEIPAPRIVSAVRTNPDTNEYRIRFRSIEPKGLVGFVLYATHQDPGEEIDPAVPGFEVFSLPTVNLGQGAVLEDGIAFRTVRPGARSLDQVLGGTPPPAGPYLIYRGDRLYEMAVEVKQQDVPGMPIVTEPVRFFLRAVGWSAIEGPGAAFVASGVTYYDGSLDWPHHPDKNPDGAVLALDATPVGGATPRMDVEWDPDCDASNEQLRPMALFRRRDGAARWEQISPLFDCWTLVGPIVFQDEDVQEGHWYQYSVVRLDKRGEFDLQYGPSAVTCFDTAAAGTCGGAPPP